MKRLFLLFGLILLLASCEKDIEFNGVVTDPLMVVNAIIPQDSLFEIKITKSRFFMQHEDTFETVKNATVELYVNGLLSDTMAHAGNGLYTSTYKVKEGDFIRIVSQAPTLKTTTAEIRIVSPANVVKLDTSIVFQSKIPIINYDYVGYTGYIRDTIGWSYQFTVNCKLTFSDPPNSENFYRLVITNKQYLDSVNYTIQRVWYEKKDVVFGESEQTGTGILDDRSFNYYGTFTDELFEGKTYPLTFSFDVSYSYYLDGKQPGEYYKADDLYHKTPGSDYTIDLQTLTKSYYLYLVTSSNYNADDLFAEPVQIHSNIKGGIGILGNYSHHVIPVNLPH